MVRPLPRTESQQKPDLGLAGPVQSAALTDDGFVPTQAGSHCSTAASRLRMNVQYKHSPIKSHHSCLRYNIPKKNIVYDESGISGLMLCESSTCVHCARKKHIRNAEMVTNIISNTAKTYDYGLLTLTFSTDCSVSKQMKTMKAAWSTFQDSVTTHARRCREEISFAWSLDATFCLTSGKTHLHKHAIVRTTKFSSVDWGHKIYSLWSKAVRKHGGGETSSKAFDYSPVQTAEGASKYLFKSASEALINQSKRNGFGDRVGFYGLVDAILAATPEKLDKLVAMYRGFCDAVKRQKWFYIAKKMKQDFVEPTPEEEVLAIVGEEGEERKITPMVVSPHFHRAVCDSGYLWLVYHVLQSKKDGDIEVEMLRYLVEKYSSYDEEHWKTEANYKVCIEEVTLWGSDFE